MQRSALLGSLTFMSLTIDSSVGRIRPHTVLNSCTFAVIVSFLWSLGEYFRCHHLGFGSLSRNEEGPYDNDHHPSLYAKSHYIFSPQFEILE